MAKKKNLDSSKMNDKLTKALSIEDFLKLVQKEVKDTMEEPGFDELEDEEEIENYITLTDDDGNEVSFEIIGTVEYEEHLYAVLLPFDDEDDEVVILEVIPGETPEEDDFVSVNDDELLGKVFEEFKKNYDGEYEFE